MAMTKETFRALPDRRAAFTLMVTNMRWRMRVIGDRLIGWLDVCERAPSAGRAGAEEAQRRAELLEQARELRAELDLLIGELDARPAQAREAA